ncbi:hypothetical protein [Lacibacter sp.]|uniref:hypothetical protein n=1 Tax=Lacibacter sp. TaxID=1915409 RepID=UPI002B4B3E6D|nr:hypothetical protein [Lacibacter sp.]HLP39270.1 hypothetical protein [Lacibacter sp.]
MDNEVQIISTYDNNKVQLVFNETFLCLDTKSSSIIDVTLGKKILNWKFRIVFSEEEKEVKYSTLWQYNIDEVHIKLTLYNWISDSPIELKKAQRIKSKDGDTFYFKIRTELKPGLDAKPIHLSVWKAI